MSIPFIIISVLGLTVFFRAGAWPVGLLFTGLALVYVAEFFASFKLGVRVGPTGGSRPTWARRPSGCCTSSSACG